MSDREPEPADPDESAASPAPPTYPRRRSRWWVAAITFVLGAVVGVLVVGLLDSGGADVATEPPAPPDSSAQPAPSASASPVPVTATAEVNAACLNVINEALDVYTILSDVDDAVSEVDLNRLDDIVRRLQPVQRRLERDLQDCRVRTSASGVPSYQPPPVESPTPVLPQPSVSGTR